MSLRLGIDTGGTFTDAVLVDDQRNIINAGKSLTTRFDLSLGIGDVIGQTQGGYINDDMIGAQARRWLRVRGQPMSQQGKPWFQAVNLVNPHDVMFYNTDVPGQNVQDNPKTLMPIAREPSTPFYQKQWNGK